MFLEGGNLTFCCSLGTMRSVLCSQIPVSAAFRYQALMQEIHMPSVSGALYQNSPNFSWIFHIDECFHSHL